MDLVWRVAGHLDDLAWADRRSTSASRSLGAAAGFVLSLRAFRSSSVAGVRVVAGAHPAVSGVLYTIPSLALFAALVPVTGFSLLTAEIPLVLYTLLILIRNIVAGLDGVARGRTRGGRWHGLPGRRACATSSFRWRSR